MEPFLKLKLSVLSASLKSAHLFLLSNVFLTVFCLLSIQSTLVSNSLFSGCFDGVGGKGRSILMCFVHVIQLNLTPPLVIVIRI